MSLHASLEKYIPTIHDGGFVFIDPQDLVFEENVKMNCYYCGKYDHNWRCPPNLPEVDFPKMMTEFEEGIFLWSIHHVKRQDYDLKRNESSVQLHRTLLKIEKWMWDHNCSNVISFGAGSCKLCKDGCGKDKCNNPYMSRSPIEATGINVVKSAKKYGIDIKFPTNEQFIRLGMVLFQKENEE